MFLLRPCSVGFLFEVESERFAAGEKRRPVEVFLRYHAKVCIHGLSKVAAGIPILPELTREVGRDIVHKGSDAFSSTLNVAEARGPIALTGFVHPEIQARQIIA